MTKRIKGITSSAGGAFGALNAGEVREVEDAIADDLIASGAAELAEEETAEVETEPAADVAQEWEPVKTAAKKSVRRK